MSAGSSPLRVPLFRALWIASIISNIGSTMNDTAAVWTMTTLTSSPTMVSLMQTMSSLPLFLFALPAGALADLVDRRNLIQAAQVGALLTATGMALLSWAGMLSESLLLLATFQLGLTMAFRTPAWQALIPEIVEKKQLSMAIVLGGLGYNIARALGPILGGILVAWLGPAPVFGLNALSFVAVIVAIYGGEKIGKPRSAQREQMLGAMAAAIRYVNHAPVMKAVLLRGGVHMFSAVAPVVLLPIIIHSRGWTGADFGIQMGCYGAGAITIALLVLPKLRNKLPLDRVIGGASWCAAASTFALAFVPGKVLMGLVLFVIGGSWLTALNSFNFASQSAFPNWVRARSSAIYLVVMQGAFAGGAAVWGLVTDHANSTVALEIASVGLIVSAILCRYFPISHVVNLDLSPSPHWPGPVIANAPALEDGPILVSTEYRIDPAEAAGFRKAMFHLREIRLRDGAFRCSVFNDLDDPWIWQETFLVGSWAEYLRQHERATVADRAVEEAVLKFHQSSEAPKVQHLLMTNLRDKKVFRGSGD
ncbi:MFS transporter [Luteolibacter pohnpeiensis]|uniref:MFS transporter n=1 Tax=Luteolibacter pohnpeiensis TaxID=454153 RepID=A0A934S447_9BACT|nr:MFS transporter [Luteolibacter pohnpeiensis]MBK1882131.1 MFS transporter [Luteolibacter pohnpeiensis]